MKVRILGNSFRFRLKDTELHSLLSIGTIKETVEFGASATAQLHFCLQLYDSKTFEAALQDNEVIFYLPRRLAENWISTDLTGIEANIACLDKKNIRLLVEKDFKCTPVCYEKEAGTAINGKDIE